METCCRIHGKIIIIDKKIKIIHNLSKLIALVLWAKYRKRAISSRSRNNLFHEIGCRQKGIHDLPEQPETQVTSRICKVDCESVVRVSVL